MVPTKLLRYASQLALVAAFAFAFLSSFALTKAIIEIAGVEVYSKYTLYLAIGVGIRICWYGIVATVFSRAFSIASSTKSVGQYRRYLAIGLWGPFFLFFLSLVFSIVANIEFRVGEISITDVDILAATLLGLTIAAAGAIVEIANSMMRRGVAISAMIYPALLQIGSVFICSITSTIDASNIALIAGVLSLLSQIFHWMIIVRRLRGVSEDVNSKDLSEFIFQQGATMVRWIPAGLMARAADRWILASTLSSLGFATTAVIILLTSGAMAAGTSIIARMALPRAYELAGNGDNREGVRKAQRIVRVLTLLVFFAGSSAACVVAFLGKEILAFVGSAEMSRYSLAFTLAALGATLQSVALVQLQHGHILKRASAYTNSKYLEGISYVAFLAIFIAPLEVTGFGVALLASGGVSVVAALIANKKVTGQFQLIGSDRSS